MLHALILLQSHILLHGMRVRLRWLLLHMLGRGLLVRDLERLRAWLDVEVVDIVVVDDVGHIWTIMCSTEVALRNLLVRLIRLLLLLS